MSDWERLGRTIETVRSQDHESGEKPLCREGYAPLSLETPEGASRVESFRPVPLGSMTYLSSEFYVQRISGEFRSQLHVQHPEGSESASVVCTARHALSPEIDWQTTYPTSITSLRGARSSTIQRPVTAEVKSAGHSWRYEFGPSDSAASAGIDLSNENTRLFKLDDDRYQLIVRESRENGLEAWVSVLYSFNRTRSSGGSHPGNSGNPTAGRNPHPAPSRRLGFATLPEGRYRFVAAYVFSHAVVQGQRIEMNFVETAGSSDPTVGTDTGRDSGLGYYAHLGVVSEFDKTGPSSVRFTLRNFNLSVSNGGYNYSSRNAGTLVRTGVSGFGQLGLTHFSIDRHSNENQYVLTRTAREGDIFFQVRVIVQYEPLSQ